MALVLDKAASDISSLALTLQQLVLQIINLRLQILLLES